MLHSAPGTSDGHAGVKCTQWTEPKQNAFPKLRGHPSISTLTKYICMKQKWEGNGGAEKDCMKTKAHRTAEVKHGQLSPGFPCLVSHPLLTKRNIV